MISLIQSIVDEFKNNRDVILCSIIASSGSSPRGTGAKMAVFSDGATKGTIGGGQVEYICTQKALESLKSKTSSIDSYNLSRSEVTGIGMICGGNVVVYSQYLDHADQTKINLFNDLLSMLKEKKDIWLINKISENQISEMGIFTIDEGLKYLDLSIENKIISMIDNKKFLDQSSEPKLYLENISDSSRLYIFGGGHVGKALAPVLNTIGFHVTIFDNRPDIIDLNNMPGASQIIYGDYNNISESITLKDNDYVIIMTPGHESDFEILNQVLKTDVTYIGCIGSRRKVALTTEKLLNCGHSEESIKRIHSPIGLEISAQTPEEIAISIAAELIQHRASVKIREKMK